MYNWTSINVNVITNYYLYGREDLPANLSAEDLIREKDPAPPVIRANAVRLSMNAHSFMETGPGRFATGDQIPIVRDFMNGYIGEAQASRRVFSLQEMIAISKMSEEKAIRIQGFRASNFLDENDDILLRSYIYQSELFGLAKSAVFVIEPDGSRYIENFAILPYDDDFDFKSDSIGSKFANLYLKPRIDPWDIGRTVYFEFDRESKDSIARRTYDSSDYAQDSLQYSRTYSPISGPAKLALKQNQLISELWSSGSTKFIDSKGRVIVYGSHEADSLRASMVENLPSAFSPLKTHYNANISGVRLIGAAGADILLGGNRSDHLLGGDHNDRLFGGEGNDILEGGEGDDLLQGDTGQEEIRIGYDTLMGGSGVDRYIMKGNFGEDTIIDPTHDGYVIWDGIVLRGGKPDDTYSNVWGGESQGVRFIYTLKNADATGRGTLVITKVGDELNKVTIEDFKRGDFNIVSWDDMSESPPAVMLGGTVLLGDRRAEIFPYQATPNSGRTWRYAWENTQRMPNGTLVGGVYEANFEDVLRGGEGSDALFGKGGNDALDGNEGDDLLEGEDGNDALVGGEGADELIGGDGDDIIISDGSLSADDRFGPDDTFTHAGVYRGTLVAGGPTWSVQLDVNGVYWFSGFEPTSLQLDGPGDLVNGGMGNDVIIGSSRADIIEGGAGDDNIWGLGGSDNIISGEGNDTVVGDGNSLGSGFLTNESGLHHGDDFIDGGDGQDYILGQGGSDIILGGAGKDTIYGDQEVAKLAPIFHGNDFLDGGAEDDKIYGGGGDDQILGGDGNDWLAGEDQTSTVDVSSTLSGDDMLDGGNGDDTLIGGNGQDGLYGGTGQDFLHGGAGDDLLDGGAGDDYLKGGLGSDTYVFSPDGGHDVILDVIAAEDEMLPTRSIDFLQFGQGIKSSDLSFVRGGNDIFSFNALTIYYGNASVKIANYFSDSPRIDQVFLSFMDGGELSSDEVKQLMLQPTTESDVIYGYESDDVIFGLGGTDQIYGGGGNDRLMLSPGAVDTYLRLYGQDGNDELIGGGNGDELYGGDGNDSLYGGMGQDRLDGGRGNDFLYAGGAGLYYDFLSGGEGSDTYVMGDVVGNVYIGWQYLGHQYRHNMDIADIDRIVFEDGIDSGDVRLTWDGLVLPNGGVVNFSIGLDGPDATDPIDEIEFSNGEIWTGADILSKLRSGTAGPDVYEGASGVDYIRTLDGNDFINANDGADVIEAGKGNDRVGGGLGDDVLRYNWGDGNDFYGSHHSSWNGDLDVLYFGAGIRASDVEVWSLDGEYRASDDLYLRIRSEGGGSLTFAEAIGDGQVTRIGGIHFANGEYWSPQDIYDKIVGKIGGAALGFDGGKLMAREDYSYYSGMGASDAADVIVVNAARRDGTVRWAGMGEKLDTIYFEKGICEADIFFQKASDTSSLYIKFKDSAAIFSITEWFENPDQRLQFVFEESGVTWDEATVRVKANAAQEDRPAQNNLVGILYANKNNNFSYTFSSNLVFDPDPVDRLNYSMTLTSSSAPNVYDPLPAWLTFDPLTRTLSGTPGATDVGNLQLLYWGTGVHGGGWGVGVSISVGSSTNRVPSIANALADHGTVQGVAFNYSIPANTFIDPDGNPLTYAAVLADGSSLSTSWLSFNPTTRTFSGHAATVGTTSVRVTATDGGNLFTSDVFDIVVKKPWVALTGTPNGEPLTGGSGEDTLNGMGGNDTLDGGVGKDLMIGGSGDDVYKVDHVDDQVRELQQDGNDLVFSSVSFQLPEFVENLTLIALDSTTSLSGYGNDLWNTLIGTASSDLLDGRGGNDALDGGAGNDIMLGGEGDDVFYVDSSGDEVVEFASEGFDSVESSVSYSLRWHVEELRLTGSGDIDGSGNDEDNALFGNEGANYLRGGAGKDYLDGGLGRDSMEGGTGNDVYYVDDIYDEIYEAEDASGGSDTMYTAVDNASMYLGVENLIMDGNVTIRASGSDEKNLMKGNGLGNRMYGYGGNDSLYGMAGNDWIDGGLGDDFISGGAGNDWMVDSSKSSYDVYAWARGLGQDQVSDYGGGADKLEVSQVSSTSQLWFEKSGDHLKISIIGTTDTLTVNKWFSHPASARIESITVGSATLSHTKVEALVEAMGRFSAPAVGQTTLPPAYQTELAPVLAASWS